MVKSGEELQNLFTSPNALFIGVCEGGVKSEEYFNRFFICTFKKEDSFLTKPHHYIFRILLQITYFIFHPSMVPVFDEKLQPI